MVARYLNNDRKAETQIRETQATKSEWQTMNHIRGQTGTSLEPNTRYMLNTKYSQTEHNLCKNFNFLLTVTSETSQQSNIFIHSTAMSVNWRQKFSWNSKLLQNSTTSTFFKPNLIQQSTRPAMPMSPEIFTSLERFAARRTRERSVGRVDPLMKSNGRWVFEAFTAVPTLALIQVAMPI